MKGLRLFLALVPAFGPLPAASAWEEQPVLEFILIHNPLPRAYRVVTEEYTPRGGVMDRMKEYTSLYGRAGAGGTDYLEQPLVIQAGVQIVVPLTSTKERREHAMKAVKETRAMDEIRGKALADIAKLRQHEADLSDAETRLKFYEDKSGWLQKRAKDGFEDVGELWNIGQKLHEDRAAAERPGGRPALPARELRGGGVAGAARVSQGEGAASVTRAGLGGQLAG